MEGTDDLSVASPVKEVKPLPLAPAHSALQPATSSAPAADEAAGADQGDEHSAEGAPGSEIVAKQPAVEPAAEPATEPAGYVATLVLDVNAEGLVSSLVSVGSAAERHWHTMPVHVMLKQLRGPLQEMPRMQTFFEQALTPATHPSPHPGRSSSRSPHPSPHPSPDAHPRPGRQHGGQHSAAHPEACTDWSGRRPLRGSRG